MLAPEPFALPLATDDRFADQFYLLNPAAGERDLHPFARPAGSEAHTWQWNQATNWIGQGMHFSEHYGFGLVDALAPLWGKWKWKGFANRDVNVGESLRAAMHANPHMRVYVASGIYDLGTPHAAGDWTIAHLGLRPELRANVRVSTFEAGHMMYVHGPSLARMAGELRAFVAGADTPA